MSQQRVLVLVSAVIVSAASIASAGQAGRVPRSAFPGVASLDRIDRLEGVARRVPGVVSVESWGAAGAFRLRPDGSEGKRFGIQAPPELRFDIFYAVSNNRLCWVDIEHAREVLGYVPRDRAEERLGD